MTPRYRAPGYARPSGAYYDRPQAMGTGLVSVDGPGGHVLSMTYPRPDYGILHYPNRTFAVDYTPALEAALLELLQDIRAQDRRREVHRSHDSATRCSRCGFRSACDQRLM